MIVSKDVEIPDSCPDNCPEKDMLPTIEDLKDYTDFEEWYQREYESRWPW